MENQGLAWGVESRLLHQLVTLEKESRYAQSFSVLIPSAEDWWCESCQDWCICGVDQLGLLRASVHYLVSWDAAAVVTNSTSLEKGLEVSTVLFNVIVTGLHQHRRHSVPEGRHAGWDILSEHIFYWQDERIWIKKHQILVELTFTKGLMVANNANKVPAVETVGKRGPWGVGLMGMRVS